MKPWVIQIHAHGILFAVASEGGKFVLQIVHGNVYRNCCAWNSEFEANQFLARVRKDEKMDKMFHKFPFEIVQIEVLA